MSIAYINLYEQGFYHRAGKPGTMTVHPGDMYATRDDAIADISKDAPYVATVPVDLGDLQFRVYPASSVPVSIRESRKWFAPTPTQEMIEWDPNTPGNLPITHSVGETFTAEPSQVVGMRPLTAFAARAEAVAIETGDGYDGPSYAEWARTVQP